MIDEFLVVIISTIIIIIFCMCLSLSLFFFYVFEGVACFCCGSMEEE